MIDEFFLREAIHPRMVMETENVEIIKALVRHGLGITIVSTPRGVLSDAEAREQNVGGEVLAEVF